MIHYYLWTLSLIILVINNIIPSEANIRNPLKDPFICGRPECEENNKKFDFHRNIRYKYDYRMHVKTEFSGSGENSSDVFVSASVILTFPKSCEGVLQIQEIELREKPLVEVTTTENTDSDNVFDAYDDYEVPDIIDVHPRSEDFANNIQRNDLRFAFHDGVIGEACSAEDEDIWVLNFKKGILSALQNSMKRFDVDFNTTETDISGTCDVVYTLDGGSGTSLLIIKTKNIISCTNRYKTNSVLQTTPYDFRKNYAVWPILQSDSYCKISVDHNVYQDVICYERHQLVPFSNNQSGAVTESKISLTLVDEELYELPAYDDPAEIEKRSTLLFNHYPSPKPIHGEIKAARDLLKEMCRLGFPDIQRDFIDVFTKFLQTARVLSYTALYQLLSRASSICSNGKNHVMESLPYIGSTPSVELMKDQIIKNQVPIDVAHKWLSLLSFIPRPDEEMLQSFYNLIEYGNQHNDHLFILTSTAVAHTYCRHNVECDKIKEIKKIVRYLEDNISQALENNVNDRVIREKIVVLLKGLGNIGVITKSFEKKLKLFIGNETLPMDIRLQTIFSHRRLDCQKSKEYFLNLYRNFQINSEIRIASYLQMMRCPDYVTIKNIKYVLEEEEINQVGSYVWSHLNNLAKSASPVRVAAQGLLVDGDLGTKYKLDIRKFSRNFEHSLFFDEYNFGGFSDANLIFGTESYMPRALSFNLTADLFGESVNFFEGSARMQGFEELVQTYFGPKGPLTLAIKEKIKNASGIFSWLSWLVRDSVNSTPEDEDYMDRYNHRLKRKSESSSEENMSSEEDELFTTNGTEHKINKRASNLQYELSNNVKSLKYNLNYDFNKPRLAYGFKVFGNDLKYGTIEGINEIFQTLNQLDPMTHIKNLFSGQEITYTKSGVFLDASYEVPLIVGLPLAIHAFGASSVDLRMSGSLGAGNFMQTQQLDIEGKLKPSVSVDVIGTMQSDYFYGVSGVRVYSNLYSSSSIEAKLKIRGTRLISLQFSLPQDRNDIFSARSKLIVITRDGDLIQKGIDTRYTNSTCTWPMIDKAVGLKLCADYSLPDVSNSTKMTTYPSLLFSGPIDINIELSKADLTAKTYLFEYRWDDAVANTSSGSMIFETPGSVIPRKFSANMTSDLETYNASMIFQNGDQFHSAVAKYKNTPNDKRFEIYFELEGQKNLALEMSLNRTEIKYGWVYYPRFLITVNDERIAGLAGTLKATNKKGIYQYDINLTFETKRLQTHISGYVTLTDVSFTPKLKIDYLFLDNKRETVEIDGELANRSSLKTRTEYNGALTVKATAYPQFNFASKFKFLSLLGHVECKLDVNNAPDLIDPNYTLTIRLIFARFHLNELKNEGSRTTASIDVTRPRSNTDFKLMLKHEEKFKTGPEHNVLFVLRFAPKKEATAIISVHLPRGPLFAIDAVLNITVPAFDSCAMALRLVEKKKNDYNIDFQGTWFSGHSIIIKGVYQDKSTVVKTYYHLKLMAKSPHFDETTIDLRYWRDETELTFDLQVFYAKQPFALLIKHSEQTEFEKILYTELKLREKIYSLSANMRSQNPKQLFVELHIDKLRDVHLILRGLSTDHKKEAGIEIKWDANRDPTQKLAIAADFNIPNYKTYDGSFLIAYPERTFSATFDLYAGGPDYRGNARLGWSSYESIDLNFIGWNRIGKAKDLYFNVKFNTPFDGWKHNAINGGLYHYDNLLLVNSSAVWAENQNLAVAFMGDYSILDPEFTCEIKLGINSTIKDVPSISAHLKHTHDLKKLDSDLNIRHTPLGEQTNVFSIKSIWQFDYNVKYRNVTGSIALRSPFAGYRTGAMSTKFSLTDKKQLRGAADLDIEEKKFTLSVEGHVKKFTDNMLVTNITTPIEKFRNIVGRFGISEKDRHIVAEVRGPHSALGIELLFAIITVSNFDVKFNLETPVEAFEKIMIIGKMKPETVDFRGAWNKIVLGYVGVSRLAAFNDFEYSYKVYTPIEHFTENGFVAKLVQKDDFDLEITLKFAQYKLGIVVNAKPKPKLIRQLGLKRTHELLNNLLDDDDIFKNHDNGYEDEDNDDDNFDLNNDYDDEDELLNFIGNMELYTLLWPTIIGALDVDEIDDTYLAFGTLILPQGTVELRDQFFYPDYFNMKNTLKIITPFSYSKEIRSIYEHSIDLGNYYTFGLDISILNVTNWLDTGFNFNYTTTTDEAELKTYDVLLNIKTPIKLLPKIGLKGNIELEDSIYRGNFSATTIDTHVSIGGSLESDENYVDALIGLELSAPAIPKYVCKAYFKKDFSDIENTIDLGFEIHDNNIFNKFQIDTMWHTDRPHYLNAKGKLRTNIIPIQIMELSMLLTKTPNLLASLEFAYALENSTTLTEFRAKMSRKKEHVHCELITPIQDFGNISLQGSLSSIPGADNFGLYNLMGNLYKNTEIYNIDGNVTLQYDIPIEINLKLKSLQYENRVGSLMYSIKEVEGGAGKIFKFNATESDKFIQIVGGYSVLNPINWKLIIAIVTSENILSNETELHSNRINLNATISPNVDGITLGKFKLNTPWSHLGIESVELLSEMDIRTNAGKINNSYALSPDIVGNNYCEWSWIIMEKMIFIWESNVSQPNLPERILKTGIQYENPNRNMKELNVGANLNVNSLWNFQSKSSLTFLSKSDIGISLNVQLPEPIGDVHRLSGRYRGDFNSNNSNMDINYEIKYQADEARTLLASRGQYINATDMQSLLRFEWGHDIRNDAVEANVHMLRKNIRREFVGRLATPYYIEDTLTTSGSYDLRDIYQLFNCKINYPATRQIANGDIAYSSLSNMKGFLNSTTPFTNLTWLRGDFDFTTSGSQSIRYIKTTWPKDTATFDLKSTYSYKNLERDLQGIIKIEAPLTSRHYVNIDYSLKERESITTGHTNVEYNKKQVLKGEYICKSEVRAGYTKDAVDITLENDFKPIGIIYVHVTENSGIDSPHYNMKHAELYELRNSRLVNITGEVHVRTTMTGQDYKIIAIHPNRTVVFTSDYDFQDQTTKHKSRLELAPAVWFAYYLKLQNYTTLHNESQSYTLDFSYPRRNISTDGWYAVTENAFNSDISFQWTRNQNSDDNNDYNSYGYDDNSDTDKNEPRVMRAALQWRNEPLFDDDKDNQTTVLTIRHPSFLKDVTFSGSYYKSSIDLYKTKLIVNYCDAPEHLLTLESSMRDLSSIVGYRNYSLVILAHHEISELDLNVHGSIGARPGLYETINIAKYKRGYLPLQDGFLIGLLDLQAKEISYFKQTPYKTVRLWSRAGGSFPIYTINSTLEDSPDLNSTGKFYLNIDNKYIRLNINMTPDASQNVHMLGEIPDARSASFDLWRDYEDIRVVDIAYYLRMNHSRLVTSQLIWRPKMKTEIKEKLRRIATSFYESLSENIDFWVKTLYTEAMDTSYDIWRNAKPHTQRFLDDVGGLRVLEDDIEEFRLFLNQSYEANDFYVKTVVNFTLTIIDELAIRNHIGSVPKILSEVWTVLGDSGQALRRSILWLIDTIKTSYKKTLEIISKILHGESLEHLSGIIERVVEKYDKFIKDLHLKLIKHVEHLWATMTDMISNYWKRSLHRIEPSIIKFLHYIETMIWNISKEIFDFLYKRTNELIESPYFNKVSDFTQDLDRLYKDLMANDALTNIKKYTVLGWEFLKEKYFKIVPFGKEMHDVMTELLEEIKTLKNLEIIKLINSKINEVQTKLIWIGNNLQLDQRIQQLWSMFRNKMTRIAQTALQADDKYREAKTKFIFDPDIGCIELEQKLPMSWHSFNETPKFEEIPEYKLLIDIQEFFNGNNFSLWNLYYEYKPYMDPNNWLPPFKSYSLLIGSRHFLTFDKKFVSLNFKYSLIDSNRKPEQCSYLLAHDFFDSNFTLVLEPSIIKHNNNLISTKKLALLTENEIVDIDIVGSSIRIGRNLTSTLPIQIGDTVIYRDADMLLIESDKGFNLHCNLQFDFCWFELSGWYFGKTAGLFGTMNNEHFDEFTTSTNEIMDFDVIANYNYMNITNGKISTNENVNSNNVNDFINSWALPGCKLNSNNANNNSISINPSLEIINLCDSLFKSKLSYFVNCFAIIDPKPFYKMCLDLGTNSISNFIEAKHPAHKGACTIALGYIEACAVEKTPLRIPDTCVHCDLVNGSYVPEGTFITLEGNDIPMTTDVVFIIEAKPCNRNVTINKNLNSLVSALNKELTDINIKNNRYAVVTFGGAPPFDKPRSVVYNNKIFTDHINLRYYFDHILTDNGNFSDIFEAISTATKLIFRPGASKTFILLPCSGCNSSYMRLDFSTMLQVLLEENINLHILMDQPFELDKKRIERIFFGMDREHAYTKKYLKDLKGDSDLHRQITSSLPKKHLGICTPLAFETNGTIFTSKKIRPGSRNPIKKFTSVFAKRIAQTATPNSCQTCECTGHNTGIAYMTCTSCELPNAWNLDYDFNENDMLSVMQAGTDFNWGDDYE